MSSTYLEINDNPTRSNLLFMENGEEAKAISLSCDNTHNKNVLKPDAGFVIKTRNVMGEKVFINVCISDVVSNSMEDDDFCVLFGSSHEELDKGGVAAMAYDVTMNDSHVASAFETPNGKNAFVGKLLQKVELHFSLRLLNKDWVILENRKYYGISKEQFGISISGLSNKAIARGENKSILGELYGTSSAIITEVSSKRMSGTSGSQRYSPKKKTNAPEIEFISEKKEDELSTLLPVKGPNVATIKPKPGMCVKTKDLKSNTKVFFNACISETIPLPPDITDNELITILESEDPSNFRVPMSIGDGHEELHKSGSHVMVYDVIIHPDFLEKISNNPLFLNFFILATICGLNEKFGLQLSEEGYHVLKNRSYFGSIEQQTVRTEMPLVQELCDVRQWQGKIPPLQEKKCTSGIAKREPKFVLREIKHSLTKKSFLMAVINLPELETAINLTLKISNDAIILDSAEYFLHIGVPYEILTKLKCTANFVKSSKRLIIHIPVNAC